MSIQFSDTSTYKGLVQLFEREIGEERGFISGNTNRLKEFTADVNLAWDMYLAIALTASGRWQFDDSNHTDFPIIKTDLVSGQQDYTFTTDQTGNLILDIYKVAVLESATSTVYREIYPVDQQTKDRGTEIFEESSGTSAPHEYDKTANGIILNATPNYDATNGLKVAINREASYFMHTDTTKKPGCPGLHHRYFAIRAAFDYARRHSLANYNQLFKEVLYYEGDPQRGIVGEIERHFSKREKDDKPVMTPRRTNFI